MVGRDNINPMWDHFVRQEWGKGVKIFHLSPILRIPASQQKISKEYPKNMP